MFVAVLKIAVRFSKLLIHTVHYAVDLFTWAVISLREKIPILKDNPTLKGGAVPEREPQVKKPAMHMSL